MKLEICKTGDQYIANIADLPGSPPIGRGTTKEEAVAILFCTLFRPTQLKKLGNDFYL